MLHDKVIIREMQVKATTRHNLTPVRVVVIKNNNKRKNSVGRMWRNWGPCGWDVKWGSYCGCQQGGLLQMANSELPFATAPLPLGAYPKEIKAGPQVCVHPCSQRHYDNG